VIVIHDAAGVAVHVQVGPVVTAIAPFPPAAAIAWVGGSRVNVHAPGVGVGVGAGPGLGVGAGLGLGSGLGVGAGLGLGSGLGAGTGIGAGGSNGSAG
jgi:hypothetical protein